MKKIYLTTFLLIATFFNCKGAAANEPVKSDSTKTSTNPYLLATFSTATWTLPTGPVEPMNRNFNPHPNNRQTISRDDIEKTIKCNLGCCGICCCFCTAFLMKKMLKIE